MVTTVPSQVVGLSTVTPTPSPVAETHEDYCPECKRVHYGTHLPPVPEASLKRCPFFIENRTVKGPYSLSCDFADEWLNLISVHNKDIRDAIVEVLNEAWNRRAL
jgi:RNA polymerase subunit RPABC4/transcription elongation factor Spt4